MNESGRYLIVGLGNPGRKYTDNRHNVGFRCLDHLAAAHRISFDRRERGALVGQGGIEACRAFLIKPQGFMNESGRAVASMATYYRIPLQRLLVIYDDLDLPLGTIRLRPEGGSGGHRGVRSIIERLGGQRAFTRLRVGIGRPPGQMDPAAYVLQDFSAAEEEILVDVLDRALRAVRCWLIDGIDAAMTNYNGSIPGV